MWQALRAGIEIASLRCFSICAGRSVSSTVFSAALTCLLRALPGQGTNGLASDFVSAAWTEMPIGSMISTYAEPSLVSGLYVLTALSLCSRSACSQHFCQPLPPLALPMQLHDPQSSSLSLYLARGVSCCGPRGTRVHPPRNPESLVDGFSMSFSTSESLKQRYKVNRRWICRVIRGFNQERQIIGNDISPGQPTL